MHKKFYASGFLYHVPTQQILLHQPDEDDQTLSIFSGKSLSGETPEEAFQRIIANQLSIDLPEESIHAIYNYQDSSLGEQNYFLFAEVDDLDLDFELSETGTIGWFPIKLLPKLNLKKQIRHDITIGQRVINHIARQRQEQEV